MKNAFLEFLSNPATSYGVYTPGLTLEVSCIVAGDFQVSYCTSQPVLQPLSASDWLTVRRRRSFLGKKSIQKHVISAPTKHRWAPKEASAYQWGVSGVAASRTH